MRSILLGVMAFITVPMAKNTTITQIPILEMVFNWGNIKLASDNTTAAIKARTSIFKTAKTLILGGYFPGYRPPIDAFPHGTPAAKHP